MMIIVTLSKCVLIFVLLFLFYIIFASPSYKKWTKDDVLITKSTHDPKIPKSPAITVCPGDVRKY